MQTGATFSSRLVAKAAAFLSGIIPAAALLADGGWAVTEPFDRAVRSVCLDTSGNLYVAGYFEHRGSESQRNYGRWDGQQWTYFGYASGAITSVIVAHPLDGMVAADSLVGQPGSYRVRHVSANGAITIFDGYMNHDIYALAVSRTGQLYAGGIFTLVNGRPIGGLVQWNGSTWVPVGGAASGQVGSLVVDDAGNLYASGSSFRTAAGQLLSGICRWDGQDWTLLGGAAQPADLVGVFRGEGGSLYSIRIAERASNGVELSMRVSRWDGTAWTDVGGDFTGGISSSILKVVAVDESGRLYAAGSFTAAGGVPVNYLARWNGQAWSAIGSGLAGGSGSGVTCMVTRGSALYVGGEFTAAGGLPAAGLARLDLLDVQRPATVSLTAGSATTVRWLGQAGARYSVETNDELAGGWTPQAGILVGRANGTVELFDPTSPRPMQRFYRISTAP